MPAKVPAVSNDLQPLRHISYLFQAAPKPPQARPDRVSATKKRAGENKGKTRPSRSVMPSYPHRALELHPSPEESPARGIRGRANKDSYSLEGG